MARLKSEHGKALGCYERALFFSNWIYRDVNQLYEPLYTEANYVKTITDLYGHAGKALFYRHQEITRKYLGLLRDLNFGIIADREIGAIFATAAEVWIRYINLGRNSMAIAKNDNPSLEELEWNWLGLNNISRLFMDEITHLNGRVDELLNLLNTRHSISFAVWGIGISSGVTLLALFISIFLADPSKPDNSMKNNTSLYLEMGKLNERTANILHVTTDVRQITEEAQQFDVNTIISKADALDRELESSSTADGVPSLSP